MPDALELLNEGVSAFKRKDLATAERVLSRAYRVFAVGDGGRRTAMIYLGKIYRQTGRYDEAIEALEEGLPYPGAFKELVSIYRFLGKAARAEGDKTAEAEAFRKMFSLAVLEGKTLTIRLPSPYVPTEAIDWDGGAAWLQKVKAERGNIYIYRFEGNEVGDLLSAADYKTLCAFYENAKRVNAASGLGSPASTPPLGR